MSLRKPTVLFFDNQFYHMIYHFYVMILNTDHIKLFVAPSLQTRQKQYFNFMCRFRRLGFLKPFNYSQH